MNIFEQIEQCDVINFNGNITDRFYYHKDFQLDEDGWLDIIVNHDIKGNYSFSELRDAVSYTNGFRLGNDLIKFYKLIPMEKS